MKNTLILLVLLGLNAQAATFSLNADATKSASGQPFYQSTLPAEVYQYTRDANFADLHVFNAANELVPHAFVSLPTKNTIKIEPLKFVRISEESLKDSSSLRLNIQQNGLTTSISATDKTKYNAQFQHIYLVDLKSNHETIQKLKFNWDGSDDKLIGVELATSDDLQTWRVSNNGNLLKTTNTANSILKNSLAFADNGDKYLKITITKADSFQLANVDAEIDEGVTVKLTLLNSALTFLSRADDSKTVQTNIEFEATGRYPAEALSVQLPQANTVVSLTILTRNKTSDTWQHLTTGNAYQFNQNNQTLNSTDITFSPITARYWRLQFNAAGGGIGAENPKVALKFSPQMIVWNARGNAPFSVKVGEDQTDTKPSYFSLSQLIPEASAEKIKALPNTHLTLANADSDTPMWQASALETSYKPYYLWAGLCLGLVLLLGMAFSLLRKPS